MLEYLNILLGKFWGLLIIVGDFFIVNFNFDGYNIYVEFRILVIDVLYLGGSFLIISVLRIVVIMFIGVCRFYFWLVIFVILWRLRDIWDIRVLEVVVSFLLKCGIWLYVLFVSENLYVGWLCLVVVELWDVFLVVFYCDLLVNIGFLVGYIIVDNCKYI